MSLAAVSQSPVRHRNPILSSDIRQAVMEDDSPFGVQGLVREKLRILKPECIGPLAATLALVGKPEQIRDDAFVAQVLAERSDWLAEYQVVHLIEKSLWIDGHSDLVMTLTRDPSQIPDHPPREIIDAMSQAILIHPQSTVWYGEPLFSDRLNAEGLPIPLTAAEVLCEAEERVKAAQRNALRWRWLYRAANEIRKMPYAAWRFGRACGQRVRESVESCRDYYRRAQRDARNRERAKILADSEYCRYGQSYTKIPEHTTLLGLASEQVTVSNDGFISQQILKLEDMSPLLTGAAPVMLETIGLVSIAPLLITPLMIIPCDPFLFIELPGESGKLRFLGHWYWQGQPHGKQKLHLHV